MLFAVCFAGSAVAETAIRPSTPRDRAAARADDRDLPGLLAQTRIASVSYAVIRAGRIARVAAYGVQSPGVAATPQSVYNIASLTKPLTAEVILRLASQGKLSLDEPMDRYWSDPDLAHDDRRKALTLRLALSHRTGFPNWRSAKTGLAFDREPGGAWGYSGEGYQYAARFTERKLAKPFEKLAQDTLFGPLGMTQTSYTYKPSFEGWIAAPTNASGDPLIAERATHYNAADLVYATPREYAAFMVSVLKDRGLSPAVARERNLSQVSMTEAVCAGAKAATCPPSVGFGLGWQLLAFKGETVMMHTGKDDGVFTFAYVNRATGDGVVIFTNSDNGYRIVLPLLARLDTSPAYLRFLRGQIE